MAHPRQHPSLEVRRTALESSAGELLADDHIQAGKAVCNADVAFCMRESPMTSLPRAGNRKIMNGVQNNE